MAQPLEDVARRFDALLRQNPSRTKRALWGVQRYLELCAEQRQRNGAIRAARRAKLRQVLAQGHLRERAAETWNWSPETVEVLLPAEVLALSEGQACPVGIASDGPRDPNRSAERRRQDEPSVLHLPVGACAPMDLERRMANAVLDAMAVRDEWEASEGDETKRNFLRARSREKQDRGDAISCRLHIWYRPPEGAREDARPPADLSWRQIQELPREDRFALAYARLVALRDALSLDPMVDRPFGKNPLHRDGLTLMLWCDHDAIWPVARRTEDDDVPKLDPEKLPPELAEKLLELVETDAAPLLSDANGASPEAPKDHPALTLFHAINSLHAVCGNAPLFRELAERRRRASELHASGLKALGKAASDRANTLAQAGRPFEEQWAAVTEGLAPAADPPPSNEPVDYTKALREVLKSGKTSCGRAREALLAGGAQALDAATRPNAEGQVRSIELHTKLQEADRVFDRLNVGVGDPRFIIDQDAVRIADLGECFGRTRDELRAVFETRGLQASPAAGATVETKDPASGRPLAVPIAAVAPGRAATLARLCQNPPDLSGNDPALKLAHWLHSVAEQAWPLIPADRRPSTTTMAPTKGGSWHRPAPDIETAIRWMDGLHAMFIRAERPDDLYSQAIAGLPILGRPGSRSDGARALADGSIGPAVVVLGEQGEFSMGLGVVLAYTLRAAGVVLDWFGAAENGPTQTTASDAKPAKRGRGSRPPGRAKADRVRELLTGEAPYEGTKSELAAEVGYTHPASLDSVKNFDNLWSENERKLETARAERRRRMARMGD